MVRGLVLMVVLGSVALACRTDNFECESENACQIESIQGFCEPSGYCSFPDEECSSGRRYGENAPSEIAGICVGGEAEGSTGVTPMTTTSLTSGTTSATTTTTTPPGSSTSLAETGSTGTDTSSGTSSNPIEANYVFISSEPVDLSPTFIDDADAHCNTLAGEGGLPGTYVAWLSTSSTSALDRLSDARGWVRPDGRPFVDRPADLSQGRLYYPPVLDETGTVLRASDIITGTVDSGDAFSGTCVDWTSLAPRLQTTAGRSGSTSPDWTDTENVSCLMASSRVYCFGTDLEEEVVLDPIDGRSAFVTAQAIRGDSGLDELDSQCQSEASAAGLDGEYLAVVATSSGSALSRFDTAGLPWLNAMGVPLTLTEAGLSLPGPWDTSPSFSATGSPLGGRFWTGAQSINGGAGSNCTDWTDGDGSAFAHASSSTDTWADDSVFSCDALNRVLCFEE